MKTSFLSTCLPSSSSFVTRDPTQTFTLTHHPQTKVNLFEEKKIHERLLLKHELEKRGNCFDHPLSFEVMKLQQVANAILDLQGIIGTHVMIIILKN